MRWFQKERQPEIWEVASEQPPGDIEAAHEIREICASAGSIAEGKAEPLPRVHATKTVSAAMSASAERTRRR